MPNVFESHVAARGPGQCLAAPGASVWRTRLRVAAGVLLEVVLLGWAGVAIYRAVFGQFQTYDDQGYMMLMLRLWLGGHRLYDEVVAPYGPACFLVQRVIFGWLRVPLTTDGARWVCGIELLAAVAGVGAFLWRTTSDLSATLVGQVVALAYWIQITAEPSHPHEQLLVELALLLCLGAAAPRRPKRAAACMGVVVGFMALTKINVGVFAGAACWMSILGCSRRRFGGGAVFLLSAIGVVALPAVLIQAHWQDPIWRWYAELVTVSALALLAADASQGGEGVWNARPAAFYIAGVTGAALALLVALHAWHTTLGAAWHCVWEIPPRQIVPMATHPWIMMGRLDCRALAGYAGLLTFVIPVLSARLGRLARWSLVLLKFAAAGYGLWWLVTDMPISPMLVPFAWLLVVRPPDQPSTVAWRFPRLLLGWMSILQSLWAYPVAGTQMQIASALPAVVVLVLFADNIETLCRLLKEAALEQSRFHGKRAHWGAPAIRWVGSLGLLSIILGWSPMTDRFGSDARGFAKAESIGLPGAVRTRIAARSAASIRLLASTLRDNADTFLASDGFNSLYFWTGESPTTCLAITHPIDFFTEDQLQTMLDTLAQHPRSCFVLQDVRLGASLTSFAFIARAEQRYRPWCAIGGCQLLLLRDRPLPPVPAGARPMFGAGVRPLQRAK